MRLLPSLLLASLPLVTWGAIVVPDDTGRQVELAHVPTRIVSVAPGATEMLFAAGAGKHVVATVEYSDEPAEARKVPRIGDGIAVDMERVVALRPDVIVVWPGGGNPAQIAKLESLGFPLYRQQVNALGEIPASLRRLGAMTGTPNEAERSARDIEARIAALERTYRKNTATSVLLQVWNRPIYTVGGRHLMTDALRLCGARNIFVDLNDMGPAVDVEAVIARDPQVIVAIAPSQTAREWLDEWKKFPRLKAVRDGKLIAFGDTRLPRMGPSAIAATEGLCKALTRADKAR